MHFHMQDYIIKVYNKQCESLINQIFDNRAWPKMIRTFENLQELDFKYAVWINVDIKFGYYLPPCLI